MRHSAILLMLLILFYIAVIALILWLPELGVFLFIGMAISFLWKKLNKRTFLTFKIKKK